jgi:hypothetical protein
VSPPMVVPPKPSPSLTSEALLHLFNIISQDR